MNKTDLAEAISSKTGIPSNTVVRVLTQFEEATVEALQKGETVLLTGFVKFQVQDRSASTRRNPSTGEAVEVPAGRVVKVRTMSRLKAAVS